MALKKIHGFVYGAIALAILLSNALAVSTTIKMIQPLGSDVSGVVASILGVDATATTYAMACDSNFPESVRGYPKGMICPSVAALTITQGPATIAFTTGTNIGVARAPPTMIKAAMRCNLGEKQAVCTNSFDGVEAAAKMTEGLVGLALEEYKLKLENLKTATVTTLLGGVPLGQVLVTAGVEKLTGGISPGTTGSTMNLKPSGKLYQ